MVQYTVFFNEYKNIHSFYMVIFLERILIIYFPEKAEKSWRELFYIKKYYSSIAQWQSTRLLTVGLLVRAQLGEFLEKEAKAREKKRGYGDLAKR